MHLPLLGTSTDGFWQVMGNVRWGVLAPTFDSFGTGTPPLIQAARKAEGLGFDAIWVGDHLVCPAPVLDSLCALSAIAAVTARVDLGISVLQLGLRNVVWTAKQLTTIGVVAPGRLRLGVGVGGEFQEEFTAAGVDIHTRGSRLDEMLEVLNPLLTGKPVSYHGDHLNVESPSLLPALEEPPHLVIGGRSDAALTRVARRGDQWMGMWYDPEEVHERAMRLSEMARGFGRPAPQVGMVVLVNVNDDIERSREEAAASLQGQYRLPLRVVERWTAYGPVERVADMLRRYKEAGVSEFVLAPASANQIEQYERLAKVRELVD